MTLLTTAQDVAAEIGLKRPSSVSSASDATTRRLYRHIKRAAAEVLRRHEWAVLKKTATISCTGATIYSLASDYGRMCRDTTWNETDSWRIRGSEGDAAWQSRINGWAVSLSSNARFRIIGVTGVKNIEFDPAPDSGDAVSYRYVSNAMFDSGSGFVSEWSSDGYTSLVDEDLISLGAIWRMLRSVGREFDSQRREFEEALRDTIGHDRPAELLFPGGEGEVALAAFLPETGYGGI